MNITSKLCGGGSLMMVEEMVMVVKVEEVIPAQ